MKEKPGSIKCCYVFEFDHLYQLKALEVGRHFSGNDWKEDGEVKTLGKYTVIVSSKFGEIS